MTHDLATALAAFVFVTSVTPGPNNLMLMASGATWGMRQTVPHILGIAGGTIAMLLVLGLGMTQVFTAYPGLHDVLMAACFGYLLYLAYRIATAGAPDSATTSRPVTWLEAALFQWVNPKVWAMALTVVTAYLPSSEAASLMLLVAIVVVVNLPSIAVWAFMGQAVRRFLRDPRRLRVFNVAMAALLVVATAPMLAG